MKRFCLYLISVLLLAACSNEIPEPEVQGKTERTVLAYLVANNNAYDLGGDLKRNIVDMYSGLVSMQEPATLMVYYRPSANDPLMKPKGTEQAVLVAPSLLKFVSDGRGKVNGEPVLSVNSLTARKVIAQAQITPYKESGHVATSPVTMLKVFQDMKRLAPSDSYGLIFGSHGTGWLEGNQVEVRSFGDDAGYSIDIPELAGVLDKAFNQDDLKYILFDACMMATAEVCYELRDVTDYCIGSVMETSVDGFPYRRLMATLFQKEVDYQKICDEFIAYNKAAGNWGTCSAVDCRMMPQLADWVKRSLKENEELWTTGSFHKKVQQYGANGFRYFSLDVVDFFRQCLGSVPSDLQTLVDQVIVAKNCLSGNDFIYEGVVVDENRFCGIGMYLPYYTPASLKHSDWDSYCIKNLSWSKAVEWQNYRPR